MSPMTVRWKPLLVLSGLFAVIALVGFVAIAATLIPRGSADILPKARAERAARQYDKALIHYKRALQVDGRNASIHEEMAAMFGEWAAHAPAEKRREVEGMRLAALAEAAKYGKTLREPRRQLLAAAMQRDDVHESVQWAREVLALEPGNTDAHYAVVSEALRRPSPVVPEVKRHLAALEAGKAPEVRVAWVKARMNQVIGDERAREAALARARAFEPAADSDPVDLSALLRLRALDAETTSDPAKLAERVKALQAVAKAVASSPTVTPVRVMNLSVVMEHVQQTLTTAASGSAAATKTAITALVDSIESDLEAIFQKSLAAASKLDLQIYQSYADHLRFRGERERCLKAVDEALQSPLAALATSTDVVLSLHWVAIGAALGDTKDPDRVEKADPHVKALLASKSTRYQGWGHLFQGSIDLEKAGVVSGPARGSEGGEKAASAPPQPKLRGSALNHLKAAAEQLPDLVEAQARYGVALVLSQEPSLGRQYLQNAMRLGKTDPQFQIWAAWSVVQAGYPEEAEPIVNHLMAEVTAGRAPRELEGTLHLLNGEIHQARRSPDDLKAALAEYGRSFAGEDPPASVQLRMAQIDVQLNRPSEALKRIERLRALGQGGTPAEHLAVLTLMEMGKKDEAYETLAKARRAYPGSDELVGLEAALLARDGKAKEADGVLADFLARNPENTGVVLMRAQILGDPLGDAKAARKLLVDAAGRTENSAPLVQLALLELKEKDYPAAASTIAKIRARWKEAAAADLLDAQLALEQGQPARAVTFFDAALKKDPGNRVVLFWKAQIDNRLGDAKGAAAELEDLARAGSSKELESGISLKTAAQSALANLALQQGEVDAAIRRFESLRAGGGLGGLARGDRWQLASAYAAKGQWPAARREIAGLLNDAKNPPTNDERVRAANYYRQNNEESAAVAQLDYVLGQNPAHPSAVVTRAYMLSEGKKTAEAAALIRKAIAAPQKEKPPAVFYLMLAALENVLPPTSSAATRTFAALDQGLEAQPDATELVQAKYRMIAASKNSDEAIAFLRSQAEGEKDGRLTRLLADAYRERGDFEKAAEVLRGRLAKNPDDALVAAALVRVTAQAAERAGERDDRTRERAWNEKVAGLIREFRGKFPNNPAFLQEECELAFRRGDLNRATAVTKEIDQVAKNSPVGPLLRARLSELQGRTRDAADSYAEALQRNPAQPDVRVLLGQACLKLGRVDEALRQARLVRDMDQDRTDALLLEARALAEPTGSAEQTAARRALAVDRLASALKKQPKFAAAYHLIAEIQQAQNQRDAAVATLRQGFNAVPDDAVGLAQLVELLARPADAAGATAPDKLAEARALAETVTRRDARGNLLLALAVGFHKADRLDEAMAWADKAAAKLDAPVVHLNLGDILLAQAERTRDQEQAKSLFRRAVDQYDLVLKTQANSVEAINNKAWILHTYLGQSRQALDVATALLGRVDPATLPGEFFDTLGAVQEGLGRKREAEESYSKGLLKAPEHPVLNYHMGKLILADTRRSGLARSYLEKAFASRDKLSPTMAEELALLMSKIRAN
jgi:predicted Zn-dependent protease